MTLTPDLFESVYARFTAAISRHDCGRKCAPLNGGRPVCCTTDGAVPVVDRPEWRLLKSRTDLWRIYQPTDAVGREIAQSLHRSCVAIECKGAAYCERDNRSLSCRTFPFFPYITAEGTFAGLAYFWTFEDRCWVLSNLQIVERDFVREFVDAYETLFRHDRGDFEANAELSASMRRTFSRFGRIIPLIGRDGGAFAVEPRTHVIRQARFSEFLRHPRFSDEAPAEAAD